jgi:hypothetical protein
MGCVLRGRTSMPCIITLHFQLLRLTYPALMTLLLGMGSLLACSGGGRAAWGVVGAVGGWPTGRRCPVASVPSYALRWSGMLSTGCDRRYRVFLECDGLSSPTHISKVSRRGNLLGAPRAAPSQSLHTFVYHHLPNDGPPTHGQSLRRHTNETYDTAFMFARH